MSVVVVMLSFAGDVFGGVFKRAAETKREFDYRARE